MPSKIPLTVLMPKIPTQRWSCHSCGDCCRGLVGFLFADERARIDEQGWSERMAEAPYVKLGRGWALNKRPDGACVFLDDHNKCKIHAEYGEDAKPLSCRVFPFSVRPVGKSWQATLRFDCPSVTESKGEPIALHQHWLEKLAGRLDHHAPHNADTATIHRGVKASPQELDGIMERYTRLFTKHADPLRTRLIGAARITTTLAGASFKTVRGDRMSELMAILFQAMSSESTEPVSSPTAKQRAMLRQLAFAHTEHVSLRQLRSGPISKVRKRIQQVRAARRYLVGIGTVPRVSTIDGETDFEAVDAVKTDPAMCDPSAGLLHRYLAARLSGRSVFGAGYYGWPVFHGLAALLLSIAVTGWVARYIAAVDGRPIMEFEDVKRAAGLVDGAATRAPSLGTFTERTRVSFLFREDGLARLLAGYAPF